MDRSFQQNPYARRPPFEQPFRSPGPQGPGNQGQNMRSPPQSPFQVQQQQQGRGPRHSTPFKSPPARPNMGFTPQYNQGRSPGYNNNRNSFNNSPSPNFGGPQNNLNRSFQNNRRQSGNFNNSPNSSRGRGGRRGSGNSNWMDRSGDCNPGGSTDINKYYRHSMIEDPWKNLTAIPVNDTPKIM